MLHNPPNAEERPPSPEPSHIALESVETKHRASRKTPPQCLRLAPRHAEWEATDGAARALVVVRRPAGKFALSAQHNRGV
jgi:hypothetical protein